MRRALEIVPILVLTAGCAAPVQTAAPIGLAAAQLSEPPAAAASVPASASSSVGTAVPDSVAIAPNMGGNAEAFTTASAPSVSFSGPDQLGVSRYARAAPASLAPTLDRDCSDFASDSAAQSFFIANGGPISDPHGLDRDGDGFACEWGTDDARTAPRSIAAAPPRRLRPVASRTCFTGPRGGTYTITASGNKNYSGC